jgi:hypothetical protein
MAVTTISSRSAHPKIMTHLQMLRRNLAQARDALMHYKDDRLDRDKLEPAARRVDDLMNMFASNLRSAEKGSRWIAEIQLGLEQVTNPKAAEALGEARIDIAALLDVMAAESSAAPRAPN